MASQRLLFLDTMRGFALFSVVYSHIILFWGDFKYDTWFNHYFCTFQMPLFFFVSGFLSYSDKLSYTKLKTGILKRILTQVCPALIILLPMSYIFGSGYSDALFKSGKMGYWFTISLAETYILFAIITALTVKHGKKALSIAYLICAVLITLFMFLLAVSKKEHIFYDHPINQLLSIQFGIGRMPFFFIGAFAKIYFDNFKKWILNWLVVIPLAIISILPFMNTPGLRHFNGYFSMLTVFFLFYILNNLLSKSKFGNILAYIGVNSLPIYLFHYIFIFSLIGIPVCKQIIEAVSNNALIEFTVISSISIGIIALTVLFDMVLKKTGIYKYLFFEFIDFEKRNIQ